MIKPDRSPRSRFLLSRPLLAAWFFAAFTTFGASTITADEKPIEWDKAKPGYAWEFPRDHGSHPAHRIEWWYFTGHLDTASGNTFGYQLTFFRLGALVHPSGPGPWALRDVWMAHFALANLKEKSFRPFQRFNRSGPGLAGSSREHFETWNEDWSGKTLPDGSFHLQASDHATGSAFAIDLTLQAGKPLVFQGEKGYSRKGDEPGNASHYTSFTRMPSKGKLTWQGREESVTGQSWMDHEFGTSFVEDDQQGWDWLSLQAEDGSELMLFQLRRQDGTVDVNGAGTWIPAEGEPVALAASDFTMKPGQTWKSPATGGDYPVKWQIAVPKLDLSFGLEAAFPEQELYFNTNVVSYWEGSVGAKGKRGESPFQARGYLEMTGYSGSPMGRLFKGN